MAAFPNSGQPIKANDELAIGVLPAESPLDLIAFLIGQAIKPAELLSDRDRLLRVAPVGVNDWFEVVLGEELAIGLRIKAGIQGESGPD